MGPAGSVNDYGRQLTGAEIAAKAHREFVGGLWEEVGTLQFEFMKARGLLPGHRLLDVGCGALRGGVHFIRYLDRGGYFGLDVNASLVEAGKRELGEPELSRKSPRLVVSDSFEVSRFATRFRFALAVSLFSHLPAGLVGLCLRNVGEVLEPGGRFYASYWEAPTSNHREPLRHPSGIVTYLDADSYHYSFEEMRVIAHANGLAVERFGDWAHPRGQSMLVFGRP